MPIKSIDFPLIIPKSTESEKEREKNGIITVSKPLPPIPRRPTDELQQNKTILQTIYQKVTKMIPLSCLRLIERGVVNSGGEWGIEVSSVNQVSYKSFVWIICNIYPNDPVMLYYFVSVI